MAFLLVSCSAGAGPHSQPPPSPPDVLPSAGGTLRVALAGGLRWTDPGGAPTPLAEQLGRLTSRQLVSFDGVDSLDAPPERQADVATYPDVSDDKLAVSFRLRSLRYAPPLGTFVRAADVVFGLELLCDPADPSSDGQRLGSVVVGYADFCHAMLALPAGDQQAVRRFADTHPVAGLTAVTPDTVRLTLLHREGDLLDLLARADMTPFPESAFSPETGITSWIEAPALGPYVRTGNADGSLTYTRNPSWDPTQDPLRRAWADTLTVRSSGSESGAVADVAAGRADVVLGDDAGGPSSPPGKPSPTGLVLRTTPAGDLYALIPGRASPGPCAAALASPLARRALAVGLDHRPVVTALGGSTAADARDWPIPGGLVGGAGAAPVLGRAGADGPGAVPAPSPPEGATPGSGGDPDRARRLLTQAGIGALSCSVSTAEPESGAPDPGLAALLPSVAIALAPAGVALEARASGPTDLSLERLTAPWEGDAADQLLEPILDGVTDPVLTAAIARAQTENDQQIAGTRWSAVSDLLLSDGDLVPIAESRLQSVTGHRIHAFRWYAPGRGIDLANAAVG